MMRAAKKAVVDYTTHTVTIDGEEFPLHLDEVGPSVVSFDEWDVLSLPIVVLDGVEVRR